jgi:NADH-quinone oxidoreductase subunit L
MFRLWFMAFTGEPRDHNVYEHAHESPKTMLVPLIILAFFSFVVAWGMPPWDVRGSALEQFLHHKGAAPECLHADLYQQQVTSQVDRNWFNRSSSLHVLWLDRDLGPHDIVGPLALLSAGIGIALAFVIYYYRKLDPELARAQFAGVHAFLSEKWHFDQFYSLAVVRPAVVVAQWCRWFDTVVIDGVINWLGRFTVNVSRWDGRFDNFVVDGLVNVTGNTIFGVGSWLRNVQTGMIRNYVLFLALAAIGIFVALSYVLALSG